MSSISMHAPTLPVTTGSTKDFINFVYAHESLLKHYGAIRIVPPTDYKQLLKKSTVKLTLSPVVQQITKFDTNNYIYSVDTVSSIEEKRPRLSLPVNETDFWLSLSHSDNKQPKSSVSILPKMSSFLKRVHRTKFGIRRLPGQSLLKLCGTKVLDQCVPSLVRAHGPGAIFPLASTRQRLHSFNYHHEGGFRQWYIIPACEREALVRVCQEQQTTSVCLDHGRVLIDPVILDKHKIRYYRLVQHPNEIVVLAPGALSQSFTEKASWHEMIDFALPSWLNDGHGAASCAVSCRCRLNRFSSARLIDIKIFRRELVQRYIAANLNTVIDDEYSTNEDEIDLEINEMPPSLDISSNSIASSVPSLNQATTSATDDKCLETEDMDEFNYQSQLKTSWQCSFSETSSQYTNLATPPQIESSDKSMHTLFETSSSKDFGEQMMTESSSVSRHLSFQEIMDILAIHPSTVQSMESQTDEKIDDQREILNHGSMTCSGTQTIDTQVRNISKEKDINSITNTNKTLYIYNIRSGVTKADIRHHFVGCIQVIIKRSQFPPYLKYVFVVHRTSQKAEYNRKRPIDYRRFGSDCQVKYADSPSESYEKWSVVVKNIPTNVSEEYIRDMFIGCHSIKYTPARVIDNMGKKVISDTKKKVLWGYAFLYYADANDAANLVENANKFKINNQSLTISFYNETKTQCSQRRQANDVHQSSSFFETSKTKDYK